MRLVTTTHAHDLTTIVETLRGLQIEAALIGEYDLAARIQGAIPTLQTCAQCGQVCLKKARGGGRKRYCSAQCRNAAYYRRAHPVRGSA
jgi:hypothetical protein